MSINESDSFLAESIGQVSALLGWGCAAINWIVGIIQFEVIVRTASEKAKNLVKAAEGGAVAQPLQAERYSTRANSFEFRSAVLRAWQTTLCR